jgi:hypothetical protein
MGNYRSGRRDFVDAKTTVEDCRSLDIALWAREGLTGPGAIRSGVWQWSDSRTGAVASSIGYSIDMTDPHVRLQYTFSEAGERLDYRVDLVSTSPHYGGLRWWFVCPETVGGRACPRRVRKLYLPPGGRYFACRHCCQLSYTSQREDEMNRALSKAQTIRERLGGSASMLAPFPSKPKGMRWRTYYRLRARSEVSWVACMNAGLRRLSD